jgi:hypothetical protein
MKTELYCTRCDFPMTTIGINYDHAAENANDGMDVGIDASQEVIDVLSGQRRSGWACEDCGAYICRPCGKETQRPDDPLKRCHACTTMAMIKNEIT